MTEKEKKEEEAKFALDKLMRERIITHVLQIAHVSTDTNDIENIKLQYQRNFEKYVGTYLDGLTKPGFNSYGGIIGAIFVLNVCRGRKLQED